MIFKYALKETVIRTAYEKEKKNQNRHLKKTYNRFLINLSYKKKFQLLNIFLIEWDQHTRKIDYPDLSPHNFPIAPTMEQLPVPQQETVNEFVVITGISTDEDDNLSKAIALLTHHDFNLNNAVLAFFERGLQVPPSPPSPFNSVPSQAQDDSEPELIPSHEFASGAERFEGAAVHRNLQNEFVMNHLFPNLMKASRIPNRWISDLAAYTARKELCEKSESNTQNQSPARKPSVWWMILLIFPKTLTLILTALRYIFRFDAIPYESRPTKFDYLKYSSSYSIKNTIDESVDLCQYDVATEQFNESHEHCQKEYLFLLTILVDDSSLEFVQTLLSNSKFKALFNKTTGEFKECRLFISNIDRSPEALEIAQTYKFRKVPFIFAAANVSRNPAVMSSMSLVYKANCYFGDDEERGLLTGKVIKAIKKTFSEYNPQLVSKRYDKQEMEYSRFLKEKQDEAYLESLEADRIKKQEKEFKKQTEDLKVENAKKKSAYLRYLIQSDYFVKQGEKSAASSSVRVAIKLPNGQRVIQKFLKSSSLCDVYLFVELQMKVATDLEANLEPSAETDSEAKSGDGDSQCVGSEEEALEIDHIDYLQRIGFQFELFKPLPKCVIPVSLTTIEEFGELKSGDTLLFEYLDASDEE